MIESYYVRNYLGLASVGFVGFIAYLLEKRDAELMTIYRDQSALYKRELKPGEPPSWPQWPRWLAWASRSDNPRIVS